MKALSKLAFLFCAVTLSTLLLTACDDHPAPMPMNSPAPAPEPVMRPNS